MYRMRTEGKGAKWDDLEQAGELRVAVGNIFGSVSIISDSRLLFAQGRDAVPQC
jgi:hypothetical protein